MLRLPTAALFGAIVAVPDTTRDGLSQRRTMIMDSFDRIPPETIHDHAAGRRVGRREGGCEGWGGGGGGGGGGGSRGGSTATGRAGVQMRGLMSRASTASPRSQARRDRPVM